MLLSTLLQPPVCEPNCCSVQAATIRGTFSYKNPKVHDVELRPGMTARLEGVDGEISRIHFIDPNTNAPKPPPTTAVFKNLTSNTTQVHSWMSSLMVLDQCLQLAIKMSSVTRALLYESQTVLYISGSLKM